ncbi:MAG: FAD-dependent oxidoreductase, partial [Gammaproteobacteria bacterium]|nr:FAD-dependent oxidoreductase [Gammaproteobacteria bacterium]
MTPKKEYDWAIIGGGIAGISIAEMLSRDGFSVIVIEKNAQLASETSKVFHEWLHTGSLYTLIPDKLLTLSYLLGAIDDIFEFYGAYSAMNLVPSEAGFSVKSCGWFNDEHIRYKYSNRRFNPVWLSMVSRSISIINLVSSHDWLRRRAGSDYGKSIVKASYRFSRIPEFISSSRDFIEVNSPDITMNSRNILHDLVYFSSLAGVEYYTSCEAYSIKDKKNGVEIETSKGKVYVGQVAICSPDFNAKQNNIKLKCSYAPIAVVENVADSVSSFVELDYHPKKCINLIKKGGGVAQIGGISVNTLEESDAYISYVISQHKKRYPCMNVIGKYVGVKKELVFPGQDRNYLYHIVRQNKNT